jgi:hypothetical protein
MKERSTNQTKISERSLKEEKIGCCSGSGE